LIDSWSQFTQDATVFLEPDAAFALGKKNKGNASTCLCFGLIWKGSNILFYILYAPCY